MQLSDFDGHVFDMDGVVTDTAGLHERAWKATFDDLLHEHVGPDAPPFTEEDYVEHVDGIPRYDGVAAFLASRGIDLPRGEPSDPPEADTVCGVGNRKNRRFLDLLAEEGPERYPSTIELIEHLRARGKGVAVISASRNAHEVLEQAGVHRWFQAFVTGKEARELGLPGKPAPDVFEEAARQLEVTPQQAVVYEDARSGVEAGRAGGFGMVVGIDRRGSGELAERGADVVVEDLDELLPLSEDDLPTIRDLPEAEALLDDLAAGDLVVLLDYDGTLTPIVDDPAAATLAPATREAMERLGQELPLAIVSGRDRADVEQHVGIEGIAYAGSHGFDIHLPDGTRREIAAAHGEDLDAATEALRPTVEDVPGARLERKRFAIAVHDREVHDEAGRQRLADAVERVGAEHDRLRVTGGKRIHELRPAMAWDKGRAIVAVLDELGLADATPMYIGDDETDEDGFRSVKALGGHALVVRGEDDHRRTLADAALADPAAVRDFLVRLREVRQ